MKKIVKKLILLVTGAMCGAPLVQTFAAPVKIKWAGYDWVVKQSPKMGPGPNAWSADNVFVDAKGWLHLLVKPTQDSCVSGQIISEKLFGEGTYEFEVEMSNMEKWTEHLVLGLFQYPLKETGPDKTHEIDIELSYWGKSFYYGLLNFTVWPMSLDTKRVTKNYKASFEGHTYFAYTRSTNKDGIRQIDFVAKTPKEYTWTFTGNDIVSNANMPVELNLWCYKGVHKGLEAPFEVVVKSFKFTPK